MARDWIPLLALPLLALIASPAAADQADEVEAVARRVLPAVAAIEHRVGAPLDGNALDAQSRAAAFFVSAEGHLVTSAELVNGRREYTLHLRGGAQARARLLGIDPLNHIAVLQATDVAAVARHLGGAIPALTWGASRDLLPGQTVFTVGNAFDSLRLDGSPTFSRGVVSAIGLAAEGSYHGMAIETDAAVNPGSFGGPLLDREGRVIGVVTPSYSPRRFLGVAIPADQVRLAVEAIVAGRPLAQGRLGVGVETRGGLAASDGLLVARVLEGSHLAELGVKPGARLLRLNTRRLHDEHDLARLLAPHAPGSEVRLEVRDPEGATRRLEVVLGRGEELAVAARPRPRATEAPTRERPRAERPRRRAEPEAPARPRVTLGVRVEVADGRVRVLGVEPASAAARAGVAEGDVIMALVGARHRQVVRSLEDLSHGLAHFAPGDAAGIVVIRDGEPRALHLHFDGPRAERPAPTPRTEPRRPRAEPRAEPAPRAEPGFLGVYLDPQSAGSGAAVDGTVAGSPAARAGLREGDLIVGADRTSIRSTAQLVELLRAKRAGERLVLRVRRGEDVHTLQAVLGERPAEGDAAPTPAPSGGPRLGAALELRSGRLVIVELDPAGPLAASEARPGDVLVAFAGRPVRGYDELAAALARARPGQRVTITLERDGWTKDFEVRLAGSP